MRLFFLLALVTVAFGCGPTDSEPEFAPPSVVARPALDTAADSLAWRIVEGAGGLDAWQALDRLRFDFAVRRDTIEAFRARHLWEPATGRYRVEYPAGEDSTVTVVLDLSAFDVDAPAGLATLNGVALDSAATRTRLTEGYERYLNDTYWLLAPLKLFDPGVERALAPDSSTAATDALLVSFENVGLTPGDQYWLAADSTGAIQRWSFVLESGSGGTFAWEDYANLPTIAGSLRLATRKQTTGRAILTPVFPTDALPDDVFERPDPIL